MNALAIVTQPTGGVPQGPEAYCFGEFQVLAGVDLLYLRGEVVPLEPRAVQVLRHLVRQAGRVVTKEELLDQVWPDTFVTDGVLKKAVSQIRRALDDPPQRSRFVETYHRRGYRFVAPVQSGAGLRPSPAKPAPLPVTPRAPLPLPAANEDLDFDRLAGRETELEALRSEYRRAVARRGAPLLVLGEPGIGKTQLSRHLQHWASLQGARCLYTRFFDYAGSRLAPCEVFLGLLRDAVGAVSPGTVREAVEEALGVDLPAELFDRTAGPRAVSSPEAEELTRRAAGAIAACFIAIARETPLVLQLDDLQWADALELEVVARLLQGAREEPLLLVAYARPVEELEDGAFAAWLVSRPEGRGFSSIRLAGLSEVGIRQAVAAILSCGPGELEIAGEDLRRLRRLTEGNPYFLTELVRGLVAEGVIRRGGPRDTWRCERLGDLRLPTTLATAARTHLAVLAPELRELLETAAVIGDELQVSTLARVAGRPMTEVERLLDRALQCGALSTVQLSPGEDCRFRHTLVRQVLYDDLTPWRRRALHQRAAEALEEIYAAELDRVTEALAAHWRGAGDRRRAFVRDLRAAEAALGRWQWRDALACAERAREDLAELCRTGAEPPSPAERIALRTALGQSLSALGRTREAEAALEAAAEEAGHAGDPQVLATVFFHLAQARVAQGRQAEARAASERALELFTAQGDARGRALAVAQLASIRIAMGEYVAAANTLGQELERLQIQPAHTARLAAVIGWAHALQGSFAEAVRLLGVAVADRRTAADPRGLAAVLGRLQWAYLGCGEHRRALELVDEAQAYFIAAGDRLGEARMEMARGQILTARGLAGQAEAPLRRSARALGEAGDVHCEAEALWLLGQALTVLGRPGEARPLLIKALARVREVPDRDDEFRVLIDLARLCRLEGRAAEALETARKARDIAADLGSRDGTAQALAEMAGARRALGQVREALAHAEEAVALLERCGSGEVWRALHELGLAQEPWQPALAVATLERCERHLAATRDDLEEADRSSFEEVRRWPLADLHRLLAAMEEAGRAAELRSRWPVALKSDGTTSGGASTPGSQSPGAPPHSA